MLQLRLLAQLCLLACELGLLCWGHVVQERLLAALCGVEIFVEGIYDCIGVFDSQMSLGQG